MKENAKKNIKLVVIGAIALILVVAIALTVILCFSGNLSKKVEKSLESVQTATVSVAVKDGDTYVYGLEKSISFIEGGANVTTTTKRLNQNAFGLKEETLNEFVESATAKDSLSLNLSKEMFASKNKSRKETTVVVSKENANAFFGVTDAKADTDVNVKFVFEKNKLASISIAYSLVSGKTVEMTATYTY